MPCHINSTRAHGQYEQRIEIPPLCLEQSPEGKGCEDHFTDQTSMLNLGIIGSLHLTPTKVNNPAIILYQNLPESMQSKRIKALNKTYLFIYIKE